MEKSIPFFILSWRPLLYAKARLYHTLRLHHTGLVSGEFLPEPWPKKQTCQKEKVLIFKQSFLLDSRSHGGKEVLRKPKEISGLKEHLFYSALGKWRKRPLDNALLFHGFQSIFYKGLRVECKFYGSHSTNLELLWFHCYMCILLACATDVTTCRRGNHWPERRWFTWTNLGVHKC